MSEIKELKTDESATEYYLDSTSNDNVNQDTASFDQSLEGINIAESSGSSGNPDPTHNLNPDPCEHSDISTRPPDDKDGVSGSFNVSGSRDSEPELILSFAPSPPNNADHSSRTPESLALSRNRQERRVPEAGSSSGSRQVNTNPSNNYFVPTSGYYCTYSDPSNIPLYSPSFAPAFYRYAYAPQFPSQPQIPSQPQFPSQYFSVPWYPNSAAYQQTTSQPSTRDLGYIPAQTQYTYFDPSLYYQQQNPYYPAPLPLPVPELPPPLGDEFINEEDIYSDMRLNIDNMTYEELLQLEENIGSINTGVEEERITELMKTKKFVQPECPICQEEYVAGDVLGLLNCRHKFHASCVKQWLGLKNICPICKRKGL